MRKALLQCVLPALLCAALGGIQPATAQDNFPSRPLKIVSPYAPGALNDTKRFTEAQKIVMEDE